MKLGRRILIAALLIAGALYLFFPDIRQHILSKLKR